ncbi:MAG: D-alanine--D-alanine ligase [candidate division NC10 bacterium]|nr:D-alanine--D-alanine ligase [candidate division NC10 bacterium]
MRIDRRIGVLMGGSSAEREVSLRSGRAVEQALRAQGLRVEGIDVGPDIAEVLKSKGVEVAFIALHGRGGEDGTIQGLLELLGIPYTGSGVLASALAMNKLYSKRLFAFHGLLTPPYLVWSKGDGRPPSSSLRFGFPAVIKPLEEGSTIGVSIVSEEGELEVACEKAFRYGPTVLIEKYIAGKELTVGILGEEALPPIEIVPRSGFYDYSAKYTSGMTEYLVPAPLPADLLRRIQEVGMMAHQALGCAGFSRVDLRLDEQGSPFVLEVNTVPGMTETSLLPKAAAAAGYDFPSLTRRILELALRGECS